MAATITPPVASTPSAAETLRPVVALGSGMFAWPGSVPLAETRVSTTSVSGVVAVPPPLPTTSRVPVGESRMRTGDPAEESSRRPPTPKVGSSWPVAV